MARLTIKSKGERIENSSFLPLSFKFENTKAINWRFCSVFERSKMSAARDANEIRLSNVVRYSSLSLPETSSGLKDSPFAGKREGEERVFGLQMRLLDSADDLKLLRCRGSSFVVAPQPRACFFKQAVFQRELGDQLLQIAHIVAQALNLACVGLPLRVACQAPFANFQKVLRSAVIQTLG